MFAREHNTELGLLGREPLKRRSGHRIGCRAPRAALPLEAARERFGDEVAWPVQHSVQARCRALDVTVLVLAASEPHRWTFSKSPKGKFAVSLGLFGFFVVDSQIPFAVFGETVEANEIVFLPRGRPVLAPCRKQNQIVDERECQARTEPLHSRPAAG